MQLLKGSRVVVLLGAMAAGQGVSGNLRAWEAAQEPTPQVAAPAAAPQAQVAYQTVNTVECVQVPVTHVQTHYRTEYRTETVPVTRMVSEVVNEPRTVTRFIPQQETINRQVISHFECEQTTVMKKCFQPYCVTKTVERTRYQVYCTTEIVDKEITRFIPECVTEVVPVTRMRRVVEPKLSYITRKVPVTSMVPVVTCVHSCGHKCGGGACGACGGVTTCVQYQPVTTYACQQVPVMRPSVSFVPETTYCERTRTKYNPVREVIKVPRTKVNRIPYQVTECVNVTEFQTYEVPVTKIIKKPVYTTVPVCVTKMVPETTTVMVPTIKCTPVTETATRQVAVCVPYQVPVTVMTVEQRTVAHQVPVTPMVPVAAGSSQAAPSGQ